MLIRALIAALVLCLSQAAAAAGPLRIAVISDINGRYGSTDYHPRVARAIAHIAALRPNLVIATGDLVAGQQPQPKLDAPQLQAMWDSFDASVRQPLRKAGIPLLLAPGNHDASAYPDYSLERDIYLQRNRARPLLPPMEGGRFPLHYAVQLEGVLLLALDATVPGPLPAQQRDWLREALRDSDTYRAIIAFGHLPLQPVARGRERETVNDAELETLLRSARVSAYLSGHHHAWYPGSRDGIAMLSMGNLGGNQRQLIGTSQRTGFSFTVLEVDAAGGIDIRAFAAPDYRLELYSETVPPALGEGTLRLRRLQRVEPRRLSR